MNPRCNNVYNGWISDVRLTGGVREGYETHTALRSARVFCRAMAIELGHKADDPMVELGVKYLSAFMVTKAAQKTGNIEELFGLDLRMSAVFTLECRKCSGAIRETLQEAANSNDLVLEKALKSVGASGRFAV